jgi:hypothetical protein
MIPGTLTGNIYQLLRCGNEAGENEQTVHKRIY